MVYVVETTNTFDEEFKKKYRDKKRQLKSIITKLKENPDKYGKPLRGRLHGIWQLRMGAFRVWYEINDIDKKVILRAIFHKEKARSKY